LLKYAGTVITASVTSEPKCLSAQFFKYFRMCEKSKYDSLY
jgi:hypothetical protein